MKNAVGFVGLGVMGRPMAGHLASGYDVLGVDPRRERVEGLTGVKRSVLTDLGACTVVCLSLPDSAAVEAVVLGPRGLREVLEPGSLIIDLSTGSPTASRRLAAGLEERGIAYVDAPVSGGEAGAIAGQLAIMVGGSEADFQRALPYLSRLGTAVRVGDVGAGSVAKLVNNMIVGVTFAAVAEGFALASRQGVNTEVLHRAIRGGWAASPVLEASAPAIAARRYPPGGTVDMIRKDLGYALALAGECGGEVPMTALSDTLYAAAQERGLGTSSQPSLYELWQKEEQ